MRIGWIMLGVTLAVGGCWDGGGIWISFDFKDGESGWVAGFADYHADQADELMLDAGIEPLPDEMRACGTGFYIQGLNLSDDLFMFLKRRLGPEDGVEANRTYRVRFQIVFASNAPSGCFGIGGAPGESVYLKAGASGVEPVPELGVDGYYRMNVDKGNQSSGGPAASVAGNIANGIRCEDLPAPGNCPYVSLPVWHRHDHEVTANADGELWLLVGTDSGFEGLTGLYYQRIEVRLVPVAGSD